MRRYLTERDRTNLGMAYSIPERNTYDVPGIPQRVEWTRGQLLTLDRFVKCQELTPKAAPKAGCVEAKS